LGGGWRKAALLLSLGLGAGLGASIGLAACGGNQELITVQVAPEAVLADGASTAAVTVRLKDYSGPVSLSTSRGHFQDSGDLRTTVQASAGQASAVLVSCDAATDTGCAGNASVVATAGEETGFAIVTFGTP